MDDMASTSPSCELHCARADDEIWRTYCTPLPYTHSRGARAVSDVINSDDKLSGLPPVSSLGIGLAKLSFDTDFADAMRILTFSRI